MFQYFYLFFTFSHLEAVKKRNTNEINETKTSRLPTSLRFDFLQPTYELVKFKVSQEVNTTFIKHIASADSTYLIMENITIDYHNIIKV